MPTAPTGLEMSTPVRIKSTSATERAGFRRCRRSWLAGVVHRLDPQNGNVHFFMGKLFHLGLERYYLEQQAGEPHDVRVERALDQYQDAYQHALVEVTKDLGIAAQFGLPKYHEAGELAFEMLQNYFEREVLDPLLDEVIAVEFRVNVAIVNPKGRKVGVLSVQADVVGRKDGQLRVVDHKTASRTMPSAHLDLDDQLTAEAYSWWQATGDMPDELVYNVAMKKAPKPPRRLKDDKWGKPRLSKDKNQGTTSALYRAEIEALGLNIGDYVDILTTLQEQESGGEDPLFRREVVFRTPDQMAAFERDLYEEWRDMKAVALHPERAYPNPTSMNCQGCPVRSICTTMQDGGDTQAVILAGYVVADPRR